MTLAICMFILLMQFVWKYVEDLVGKGLDTFILAELFVYAFLSVIPLGLPLAILLASLMTFGNLGENFELTAMKSAGISLLKTMLPLIIVIFFISIGAFFFQNEAMPKINVKITTLMRSIKLKSPELDIPEGSFYNEIDNYNLYVQSKNKENGMMYDVKIYDISQGFNDMRVIICDSAKMRMSSTKDYLLMTLYRGQQFSNVPGSVNRSTSNSSFVSYSRENFREKEIVISFDANFNRMDESSLSGNQIAKNITELRTTIDSLTHEIDSVNIVDRKALINYTYGLLELTDGGVVENPVITSKHTLNIDSVINSLNLADKMNLFSGTATQVEMNKSDLMYRSMNKTDMNNKIRHHDVELQRKFTLSFACLIFFFIGAPLGAIIRKGGLGMPVVVSVILFIIYYIFDNVGRKMARDGVWEVWQGVWLSSFILFPLGVFLTYKAINDSALFNMDAYRNFYNRYFGDPQTKTSDRLYSEYSRYLKYYFYIFASIIILFISYIFAKGLLATFILILIGICAFSYILLTIHLYVLQTSFYRSAGKKMKKGESYFLFWISTPIGLYLRYKRKMAFFLKHKEDSPANKQIEENG